jgi:hypothetical protein
MVQVLQCVRARLVPVLVLAAALPGAQAPRFYPDDPISRVPPPVAVRTQPQDPNDFYDFIFESLNKPPLDIPRAGGVNTLGEVPDSDWFTNRHALVRMSREELKRGPITEPPPQRPFEVTGAKTDGITPGFRMRDAKGRLFFVKPDPRSNPEMSTAADVVGSRFFYALGYNTPSNYIVVIKPGELRISEKAKVTGINGKPRPMHQGDIEQIRRRVAVRADGSMRVVASLAVEGKPLGPFLYTGTRADDPNDLVRHENRRDLRGLKVFCAWLNHTDAKARNSFDTLVETGGVPHVKHYLLDFGSILGSDSDMPKDARNGNEYIIPRGRDVLAGMGKFGLAPAGWETARYDRTPAIGRMESKAFDPKHWRSNYPNPAFLRTLPDDAYWAAKQVVKFSDDDIRALVEEGQYTDAAVVERLTRILAERRDKIGRAFLTGVLALEGFRVDGGELRFDDLAVQLGYVALRETEISWYSFDNSANRLTPAGSLSAAGGEYAAARVQEKGQPAKSVTVYLRKRGESYKVVGVERTW